MQSNYRGFLARQKVYILKQTICIDVRLRTKAISFKAAVAFWSTIIIKFIYLSISIVPFRTN